MRDERGAVEKDMSQQQKCKIVSVGKRRDGGTRYWCLEHKADATAKYGHRARQCRYAHIPPITADEILKLDVDQYQGGIALWGAVPPIYDTTQQLVNQGIHVHARLLPGGHKKIDDTYRAVCLTGNQKGLPSAGLVISELDAIYYMVTSVLGFSMKYVECTLCGYPHLDKDWFSLHAHQRHLCAGCGRVFRDTDMSIGNPVIKVQHTISGRPHEVKSARRSINIRQVDYPGGIQIWGSNPAVCWTAPHKEEAGIHVHILSVDGGEPLIDEAFSQVKIDGISLDPEMVRVFMAQSTLPHLAGRLAYIQCPKCNQPHFDTGELAFTPHEKHHCTGCDYEMRSTGRLRKTIGNPMIGILAQLEKKAPRAAQKHQINLLPETL